MWPFSNPDLDTLIFDYAERKRPSDLRKLLKQLMSAELFAPVAAGMPTLPPGTKYVTNADDQIQIRTVAIGGLKLVLFYTAKNDSRLGPSFISMTGREAFEMVLKSSEEGIAIQNSRTSWFALDRQGITDALRSVAAG